MVLEKYYFIQDMEIFVLILIKNIMRILSFLEPFKKLGKKYKFCFKLRISKLPAKI